MFRKLIIAAIVATGMFNTLTLTAEDKAAPVIQNNPGEKTVTIKGWLTVTYPLKAKVGEDVVIKVKTEDVPEGYVLSADMHYYAGPKYGGFLCWQKPVTIESGKEYTMTYTIADKAGIDAAGIIFYIGEKAGWAVRKKDKDAWLKYIRISR